MQLSVWGCGVKAPLCACQNPSPDCHIDPDLGQWSPKEEKIRRARLGSVNADAHALQPDRGEHVRR